MEERQAAQTGQNKAIVIKAPMKEIEQPSKQGTYYIQVGSFSGKPKSGLLYTITRKGFSYKLIEFPKAGRSISKLLIGPYMTHKEAEHILDRVRHEIQKDAFIAEIR